jgi:hypothetical protein
MTSSLLARQLRERNSGDYFQPEGFDLESDISIPRLVI